MRTLLIALTALMLGAPMTALCQEDKAPGSGEESVDREALQEELTQARREVAEAARNLARVRRELADMNVAALRTGQLKELDEQLQALEGEMVDVGTLMNKEVIRRLHTRPRLGVLLGGEDDANEIVGVTPGSGAEKAGIESGDRLVAINGQEVDASDPESLRAPMEGVESGDTVPVEIERDGEHMTLDVTLSSPADEVALTHWIEQDKKKVVGREVDRIRFNHRGHLMRPRLGVLLGSAEDNRDVVVGLTPGSGAESAGIQPGDRLIAIAGEAVDPEDPDSLRRPLETVEPGDAVPVEIEREGELMTLEVEVSSTMPGKRYFERRFSRDGEEKTEIMIIDPEGFPEPPRPPRPLHIPPRLVGLGPHSDTISNHAGLEPYFGTAEGVVVLRIDADNVLLLQDGDVVLSINGEKVSRPVDIGRALMVRRGDTIILEVMRDGKRVTLDAKLPETRAVSRGL